MQREADQRIRRHVWFFGLPLKTVLQMHCGRIILPQSYPPTLAQVMNESRSPFGSPGREVTVGETGGVETRGLGISCRQMFLFSEKQSWNFFTLELG